MSTRGQGQPRPGWEARIAPDGLAQATGAPQSGGLSGVAAQPGEGALAREAQAQYDAETARRVFDAVWNFAKRQSRPGEYRWLVNARDEFNHALAMALAAPAPSSPRAEAPEAEPADAAALELVKSVGAHLERAERAQMGAAIELTWQQVPVLRAALRRATPAPTGERAGGNTHTED